MPKQKNKEILADLKQKAEKAKSVIFADCLGIKAPDMNNLRRTLKEKDTEVVIAKNTLFRLAFKSEQKKQKELEADLQGPTAAIFSYKDSILPIKSLYEFVKRLELPKIKSAIIDGIYYSSQKVEEISKLPPKEQLLAFVLGALKSPLSGFAIVLKGTQRKLVYALDAVATKKAEGGVNHG